MYEFLLNFCESSFTFVAGFSVGHIAGYVSYCIIERLKPFSVRLSILFYCLFLMSLFFTIQGVIVECGNKN
jgi:hypothetical protein